MENCHVEIDQEAHTLASEPQIGKQLRFMNSEYALDGLQLQKNLIGNNQINAILSTCLSTLVNNRQLDLALER